MAPWQGTNLVPTGISQVERETRLSFRVNAIKLKDVECWQRAQELFVKKLPGFWQHENIIFQHDTIVVLAAGDLPNYEQMADGTAYLGRRQQSTIVNAPLWCHFPQSFIGHLATVFRIKKTKWNANRVKVFPYECPALLAAL